MGAETAIAIGTIVSAASSIKQGMDAKKAGKENARRIAEEAEEEKRRLGLEQSQALAASRAGVGASGVRLSGSQQRYIDELSQNYRSEMDWIGRSASSRARSARREGQAGFTRGVIGGIAGGVKGYGQGKQAGWFK